ncbi:MAG: AraC family transcriptional regulator [Treponema sp.]|jgi:AraC-like DNA-binding protein|nr:AraC family transcriptional regulator [Treponema sp.]
MANEKAGREAKRSLASGFRHHDYASEQRLMTLLLREGRAEWKDSTLNLDTYADVLAPTPFRAMQNGVICFITVISRLAIALGVDSEQSFSLSDYFVCEVERKKTKAGLNAFVQDILQGFSALVYAQDIRGRSLHVTRAMRYIRSHLYDPYTVADVARYAGLNPRYFSAVFKAETGLAPSQYIRSQKMTEAAALLRQGDYNITETAEIFGYCSVSYFSGEFKRVHGESPKRFLRTGPSPALTANR